MSQASDPIAAVPCRDVLHDASPRFLVCGLILCRGCGGICKIRTYMRL
jgi:hypothetical protein